MHIIQNDINRDQKRLEITEAVTNDHVAALLLFQAEPMKKRKAKWAPEVTAEAKHDSESSTEDKLNRQMNPSDESVQCRCPMVACAGLKTTDDDGNNSEFWFEACSNELSEALPFTKHHHSKKAKTSHCSVEQKQLHKQRTEMTTSHQSEHCSTQEQHTVIVLCDFVRKGCTKGFQGKTRTWKTP